MQQAQDAPLLDRYEIVALLFACVAQIAVTAMTVRDLAAQTKPAASAAGFSMAEGPQAAATDLGVPAASR